MLISPQEMPKVAVDEMNEVHSTEVEILNKLYEKILEFENDSSKFDEVVKLFDEFLNDVIQHFFFWTEYDGRDKLFCIFYAQGRTRQSIIWIKRV